MIEALGDRSVGFASTMLEPATDGIPLLDSTKLLSCANCGWWLALVAGGSCWWLVVASCCCSLLPPASTSNQHSQPATSASHQRRFVFSPASQSRLVRPRA